MPPPLPNITDHLRPLIALTLAFALGGCAILREFEPTVQTRPLTPGEYIAVQRGDILTTGELSAATNETLDVAGLAITACQAPSPTCVDALAASNSLPEERRQSALAELWLALALQSEREEASSTITRWMEVARHSYAYLFFTERSAGTRAFEDRQTQLRDYYNLATQEVAQRLFERVRGSRSLAADTVMEQDGWRIRIDMAGLHLPNNAPLPRELVPASSLAFAGLRSMNRRDGLGAELVAVTEDIARDGTTQSEWSEMPAQAVTSLLRFPGADLDAVLATREATIESHNPRRVAGVRLQEQDVPLAANFSAGYGLWLARSGFNKQSISSLLGREAGLRRAHLYLLQPFDPERRIVVMIHGLASSPEAWTNVANEVMGDETLRRHYQIWQFYYPTNLPIPLNHAAIRRILGDALHHFDPQGTSAASRDMVLVGHSMGGVIARLMVSSSGDTLLEAVRKDYALDDAALARVREQFGDALVFEPVPTVSRAVFMAAPHRGTDVAGGWLARRFARLVRLPMDLTQQVARTTAGADSAAALAMQKPLPNSIENLDRGDPFIMAAASLPIEPGLPYHSVIARADPEQALADSNDGLVPYWSAHLDGAVSEKAIDSGHSVQELSEAVIELRRILHLHLRAIGDEP